LPVGPDAPWLAPLAGFSDLPFRVLCRENGAAVACTEMISAKGLVYSLRRKEGGATENLLRTVPEDTPLVVQLFGAEPDFVAVAAREAAGRGFVFFDLNMGCSVPKVMKTGAGAALLRDPDRAAAVGRALFRSAGEGRAGCKLRLGPEAGSSVYLYLARRLEDEGAAWLTLHPRHARQGFTGSADYAALEKLARSVSIPVLASGDLFSAEEAVKRLETGVSGVMFGRGALSDPGIFRRYLDLRAGHGPGERGGAPGVDFLLRHARLARSLSPERKGRGGVPFSLLKIRSVAPRYLRAFPDVGRFRSALARCADWDDFYALAREFFSDSDFG
jgi:tRNA-dihydrouridine synthase B